MILDIAYIWNSTPEERQRNFPCDRYISNSDSDDVYFRAVDVKASPEILFRWLCQLKIAPYSYDWIDNYGKQSPRKLTQEADDLEINQRVIDIFKLVEFEKNRHLTILMDSRRGETVFGKIAVTYAIIPVTNNTCRLVVKLQVIYPKRSFWSLMRWGLPWGDMIMMRKQLLNLKKLAEKQTVG